MGEGQGRRPTPRLALNKTEAAEAIGVSVDFFDEHVAHEVRCVRRGRRRLYPLFELERWLDKSAEVVMHRGGNVAAGVIVALHVLDVSSTSINLPIV